MIYWMPREDFLSKCNTMVPYISLVEDFFTIKVKFKYVNKSGGLGNTVT